MHNYSLILHPLQAYNAIGRTTKKHKRCLTLTTHYLLIINVPKEKHNMRNICFDKAHHEKQMLRHEVERHLAEEVATLLSRHPEEGLRWESTCIDLMEALHTAFSTGLIQDDDGLMIPFNTMVERACHTLHVKRPKNPYECAARGSRRKSVLSRPFMARYELRLQRSDHPLLDLVKKNTQPCSDN